MRIDHRLFRLIPESFMKVLENLRGSLNDMDWLDNQIIQFIQIRFSGKAVCVVFVVLVGSHSSELRIDHRLFC